MCYCQRLAVVVHIIMISLCPIGIDLSIKIDALLHGKALKTVIYLNNKWASIYLCLLRIRFYVFIVEPDAYRNKTGV